MFKKSKKKATNIDVLKSFKQVKIIPDRCKLLYYCIVTKPRYIQLTYTI